MTNEAEGESSEESWVGSRLLSLRRTLPFRIAGDDAQEVIDALLVWADVALVAFKQSDLARYGIDWDHARTVNDFGTGIVSALGVVAALRHRDQTGEGQRVDTSLLGTAMTLGTPMIAKFDSEDDEVFEELASDMAAVRAAGVDFDTQRELYESRVGPGAGAFRVYFRRYITADGLISVAGLSPGLHAKFHAARTTCRMKPLTTNRTGPTTLSWRSNIPTSVATPQPAWR